MIKDKLFGTDGIRGRIDSDHLQPQNILKLGSVIADIINNNDVKKAVVIARDTRSSGLYFENALIAGLTSKGIDCIILGVLPTGALASLTREKKAAFGIMISASHNPHQDNGLKFFDSNGFKISKELEEEIEKRFFDEALVKINLETLPGKIFIEDAIGPYLSKFNNLREELKQRKIVIDCANGAASYIISEIFHQFSNIKLIGASPDGQNINLNAGTECLENLKKEVLKNEADLGIAFDGDADRVIIIDEKGLIVDGDILMAIMAIDLKNLGTLKKDTIVATIMSSKSLDNALAPFGIKVSRADVGDRNVMKRMCELGANFGGESSGHMIFSDKSSTADGIIIAMELIDIWLRDGRSFSDICSFFVPTPRVLKDIEVNKKPSLDLMPNTNKALIDANTLLKDSGRAFLRYSGTEMKARLLVEAQTENDCQKIAEKIIWEFHQEIGFVE